MEIMAAEIRVRAERRAGELLAERDKASGKRTDLLVPREEVDDRPTLPDLGITYDQSSRWQQLAKVSEEKFEQYLEGACKARIPICTTFILDEERRRRMPKRDRAKEQEAKDGGLQVPTRVYMLTLAESVTST